MAKKEVRIRSAKVVFNVEEEVDGKLNRVQEVPLMIFELQFAQTLASLAAALLAQVNRSSEAEAEGEDQKEE